METAELLGSVDILLCFAGVVGCTHAIDMAAAEWRRTFDINTTGSFLCAQAVARQMILQGTGGSILFTASISAHRVNFPQPQVAYNVSKGALLSLKNCLAAEWARYGIRVNSISPGYMDTILNEGDGIAEGRAIWANRNPMGRMGMPTELTGAVVMLSSSAGSYINAADVVVDGGQIVF
jgi:NAD(P)-dependent dehydrogenase (short-subunit alcohol dehydrogenase family)